MPTHAKKNAIGTVVICLYIDGTLCAGEKEAVSI